MLTFSSMKQRELPFIICKWSTKWDLLAWNSQKMSNYKEKSITLHINIAKAFPFSPFLPHLHFFMVETCFSFRSLLAFLGVTWTSDPLWVPLPSLSDARHIFNNGLCWSTDNQCRLPLIFWVYTVASAGQSNLTALVKRVVAVARREVFASA